MALYEWSQAIAPAPAYPAPRPTLTVISRCALCSFAVVSRSPFYLNVTATRLADLPHSCHPPKHANPSRPRRRQALTRFPRRRVPEVAPQRCDRTHPVSLIKAGRRNASPCAVQGRLTPLLHVRPVGAR
jgi:hypothetical protein